MFWAIGFLILLVGASVAFWLLRHKIDWESGHFRGSEVPFYLGESRRVSYGVTAKRPRVLTNLETIVTLRCEEEVFYNQGTDRVRKAEDLFSKQLRVSRMPQDRRVVIETDIHIPDHLPASMDLPNNNFNWVLEIELDPLSGMSLKEKFDLDVRPQIAVSDYRPEDDGTSPLAPTPREEL